MPLHCNIDARGKLVRLVYGFVFVLTGIVLAFLWTTAIGRIVEVLLILGGCFAIFESRKGWCVIRAMGWKTPI